jgi:hypothetical protein
MSAPYCPGCQCLIDREGNYCFSCRVKFNLKEDICICYMESPEECKSKLKHYCCCTNVFSTSDCRAEEHDCICSTLVPEENLNCRSDYHE